VDWKRRLVVCARETMGAASAPAAAAPVAAFFRNLRREAGTGVSELMAVSFGGD
jgi:hypothetical protein